MSSTGNIFAAPMTRSTDRARQKHKPAVIRDFKQTKT